MKTAISALRHAAEETDLALRERFGQAEPFIHFESGYTATVVNSLTQLTQGSLYEPYPLVAVFTDGLVETRGKWLLDIFVPKTIIAVRAVENLTEAQRLESSFEQYLHPIYEEFERQLRRMHFGYGMEVSRSDVPYYTESGSQAGTFNDLLDGIIIRNLHMKLLPDPEC